MTLSILDVFNRITDACANLSNIALSIDNDWIGWFLRKISSKNFLLNIVPAISFMTASTGKSRMLFQGSSVESKFSAMTGVTFR